jgi:hypothetical protein
VEHATHGGLWMRLNLHESNPDVNGPRHHVQSTVYSDGLANLSALSDHCRSVSYLPEIVSPLRVVLILDFSVGQTWESGAFERTRRGRRAVTRPSEISRTVTGLTPKVEDT